MSLKKFNHVKLVFSKSYFHVCPLLRSFFFVRAKNAYLVLMKDHKKEEDKIRVLKIIRISANFDMGCSTFMLFRSRKDL